jgi:hypothetical protein
MIMSPTMSMTPMTTTTMMMLTAKTIATSIKAFAVNHDASPLGWSQIWSHLLATAANHSRIGTSKAPRGLPWAQGSLLWPIDWSITHDRCWSAERPETRTCYRIWGRLRLGDSPFPENGGPPEGGHYVGRYWPA